MRGEVFLRIFPRLHEPLALDQLPELKLFLRPLCAGQLEGLHQLVRTSGGCAHRRDDERAHADGQGAMACRPHESRS
jgi:hypothetical protein